MQLLIVAIAIAAAAGVALVAYGMVVSRRPHMLVSTAGARARGAWWGLSNLRERLRISLEPALGGPANRSMRTERLEADLASADWKLRAYEFRLLQGVLAVALASIGLLRFGIGVPALALAVVGWLIPAFYLRNRTGKRLRAFDTALPRAMELMGNAVKAGQSVAQSLEAVAENSSPPLAEEFRIAATEVELGASVEHALENIVRRLRSNNLRLVVMVIGITHAVGGNLPAILTTLADTMRQREEMREEVLAATAQSRASSLIITLMPVIAGGFLFFIAPDYFGPMLTTPIGWVILGLAAALLITGNVIIRRVTAIA